LQCVAVCCSVLQCVAVCCSVLQCVAVCCSVLREALPKNSPTYSIRVAVSCIAFQCVAVRCSVLQCVAVCCSVLQVSFATFVRRIDMYVYTCICILHMYITDMGFIAMMCDDVCEGLPYVCDVVCCSVL